MAIFCPGRKDCGPSNMYFISCDAVIKRKIITPILKPASTPGKQVKRLQQSQRFICSSYIPILGEGKAERPGPSFLWRPFLGFYRGTKSGQNSAKREIDGKVLSWPMIKINRKKPRRGTSYGIKDIPGGLLASQQACGREIKGAPAK